MTDLFESHNKEAEPYTRYDSASLAKNRNFDRNPLRGVQLRFRGAVILGNASLCKIFCKYRRNVV